MMRKSLQLLLALVFAGGMLQAQISVFPDFTDFETEIQCPTGCGPVCNIVSTSWRNADQWGLPQADIDWTSDVGGTGSTNTGPDVDHTLGTAAGHYLYVETSCNGTGYPSKTAHLVSEYYDFTAVQNPAIDFWYHMFGTSMGTMHLDVDTTQGGGWITDVIPSWTDNQNIWQLQSACLAWLGGMDSVRFRIRGITGTSFGSDMAVDDITVYAIAPTVDLEATMLEPTSGCGLSATEAVTIYVTESGAVDLFPGDTLQFCYSLNGGTPVCEPYVMQTNDTLWGFCNGANILSYTFTQTVDLSAIGTYTLDAWVVHPNDTTNANDTISNTIDNGTVINTFPYKQDFESGMGGWVMSGGTWAFGSPTKAPMNGAYSGDSCFVNGGLTGQYNNNENSEVVSPCFDLAPLCNPWVSVYLSYDIESNWDGCVLQASTDLGQTWTNVGNFGDPYNWFNENSADGNPGGQQIGWSGDVVGWHEVRHDLSQFAGQSVSFRFAFGSDGSVPQGGFAFDNFVIFDGVYFPEPVAICAGDSSTLDAMGNPGDTYLWSTGDTTQTTVVNQTGWYSVALTSDSACTNTDSIFVNVIDTVINVDAGADSSYCDTTAMLSVTGMPGLGYAWSTGDSATMTNVSSSGTYWVYAWSTLGACPVSDSDSVNVNLVGLNTVDAGADTTACGSVMLNASGGQVSYAWSTGDSSQMTTVSASGNYTVIATDSNGCDATDDVNVTINPLPMPNLGPDTSICANDTLMLNAGPGNSYLWSTGDTTMMLNVSAVGTYSVQVTDSNGCMGGDTMMLGNTPIPGAAFTVDTSGCPVINFTDGSTDATSWSWNFGDGNTSTSQNPSNDYTSAGNGTYNVILVSTNACGSDSISIPVVISCLIATDDLLKTQVSVVPNPSNGHFRVSISNREAYQGRIDVMDIAGRSILSRELDSFNGTHVEEIDITGASQGVYFVKVLLDGEQAVFRVVVE